MKRMSGWDAALLVVIVAQFTGCTQKERIYQLIAPADVREIEGQYVKEVEILNDESVKRLDLQLTEVSELIGPRNDKPQLAVPYSALMYDPEGKEWVYTSPEHRVFVRKQVKVDYIEGIECTQGIFESIAGAESTGGTSRSVSFEQAIASAPAPLTSTEGREKVEMVAFLKEGPEVGTKIVSVGAIELYGTEKKIGHIDAYIRKTQEHK